MKRLAVVGACLLAVAFLSVAPARAENEGQADLDQATQLKIKIKNLDDLEKVIQHCDAALKKGLDEGGKKFATQLLTSTLYQRAEVLSKALFGESQAKPNPQMLRNIALLAIRDLERLVELDKEQPDGQYLLARLNTTPFGDPERARKAIAEAIRLHKDNNEALANDYVVQAVVTEKADQRMELLNKAIELDKRCIDAYRVRGQLRIGMGKFEEAETDFNKLAALAPDDLTVLEGLTDALVGQKKFPEALAFAGKLVAALPESAAPLMLRSRVHALHDDLPSAVSDLNDAVRKEPRDVRALLMRAQVRQAQKEYDLAEADINRILEIAPKLPAAMLARSGLYAASKKYEKAANDLEQIAALDPKNISIQLQLVSLYGADGRFKKAFSIIEPLAAAENASDAVLRTRGDLYLNSGKQAQAVADYEAALKQKPENVGVLNNLAWVLCTSTTDSVRNGKRAVELATKCAELTKFEQAHILSTLAAAHAENGDFEKAIEWSTKAVAAGKNDEDKDQLAKELESYKQKKPWREEKKTPEKPEPMPVGTSPDDLKSGK